MVNAMKAKVRGPREINKSGAASSAPSLAPASASLPLVMWDDSVLVVIGASVVGDPVVGASVSASATHLRHPIQDAQKVHFILQDSSDSAHQFLQAAMQCVV